MKLAYRVIRTERTKNFHALSSRYILLVQEGKTSKNLERYQRSMTMRLNFSPLVNLSRERLTTFSDLITMPHPSPN